MRRRTVVGLVAACSLVAAPTASAIDVTYLYGYLGAGARDASSSYANYRASFAWAESSIRQIDVAAHWPGSWTAAYGYEGGNYFACQGFPGNTSTLGALVRNPHTVSQNPVHANARYGSAAGAC